MAYLEKAYAKDAVPGSSCEKHNYSVNMSYGIQTANQMDNDSRASSCDYVPVEWPDNISQNLDKVKNKTETGSEKKQKGLSIAQLTSDCKTFLQKRVQFLQVKPKSKLKLWVCIIAIGVVLFTVFICFTSAFAEIDKLKRGSSLPDQSPLKFKELFADLKTQNNSLNELLVDLGSPGQFSTRPVASCSLLPPFSPSGYYWVRNSTGSSVHVYCTSNFTCGGITGSWRKMADLDMTNSSHKCPSGFRERNDSNIRTCVSTSTLEGCYSVIFSSHAVGYSEMCGRIIGYQIGNTNAYPHDRELDINSTYVDGISLTYGNPRQHIWTFAAARDAAPDDLVSKCPCISNGTSLPPSFVGNNYFCDTGSNSRNIPTGQFFDATLWDEEGCAPLNNCCSFNTPPWFYRQLRPTAEDIEMRVCKDEMPIFEDIAVEIVEIYVK